MNYNEDLRPLIDVIEIVFKNMVISGLDTNFEKYREAFLKTKSSRIDFSKEIKIHVRTVLDLLSWRCKRRLSGRYFSHEGLILYIFNDLNVRGQEYYLDKLSMHNN